MISSIRRYKAKIEYIDHIITKPIAALNIILSPFEKYLLHRVNTTGNTEVSPVFLIGAPRSGTTLIYQVLLNRFWFAYFSNFTAVFYRVPILASFLAKRLLPKSQVCDYASKYGVTNNWCGAHECGNFWYRWFPKGNNVYVAPGTTSQEVLDELRGEVAGMSAVMKAPVLFKNVYNCMRIAPMIEAFPNACFIVVLRSPLDIALSVLKGRIGALGNKDQWWSLPPKEYRTIREHPYWKQVAEQVYYIYKQIEDDKSRFGEDHFLDMDYSAFCSDVHGELERISNFLDRQGIPLEIRGQVPKTFQVMRVSNMVSRDYFRIKAEVEELWK